MLRDLLLPWTDTVGDQSALDYAIGLAAARRAHLTIMVPIELAMPMPSPWGITPDPMQRDLHRQLQAEAEAKAQTLRERLLDANTPCAWDVHVDDPRFSEPQRAMAAHAHTRDLCVVPAPARGADDQAVARDYFAAALFESGRPVLVVPREQAAPTQFHRVLLAWQPTRECTRAVHDALALGLCDPRTALEIAVVDVHPAAADALPPADAIAAHLARHDVSSTVVRLPADGQSAATRLLLHARQSRAQLLVAGGYGHSRLREWLLGGTTRDLLAGMQLPILFSH